MINLSKKCLIVWTTYSAWESFRFEGGLDEYRCLHPCNTLATWGFYDIATKFSSSNYDFLTLYVLTLYYYICWLISYVSTSMCRLIALGPFRADSRLFLETIIWLISICMGSSDYTRLSFFSITNYSSASTSMTWSASNTNSQISSFSCAPSGAFCS